MDETARQDQADRAEAVQARARAQRDARAVIRAELAIQDWDDPWGTALMALGGMCDVLTSVGEDALIPESAGYRPAAGGVDLDDYPTAMYYELFGDEVITPDALGYWVRVLDRYADLVPEDRRY